MLAVAIRIAKRLGMHDESTYSKHTSISRELRRRLWWSLVVFDHRICEISEYKATTLVPTWDCGTPLNISDFDLRNDRKKSPLARKEPTEALFTVVRSELANFFRHCPFHLNFVNPALNAMEQPKATSLTALETTIEDDYLSACDPDDPLQFMTTWTTRSSVARMRLMEYYALCSTSPAQKTKSQSDQDLSDAISLLECDTKLYSSTLTQGYLWFMDFHVPGLAYNHILRHLRGQPADGQAREAWAAMSDNYESRTARSNQSQPSSNIAVFSRVILQTWSACETLLREQGHEPQAPPRIVSAIRSICHIDTTASQASSEVKALVEAETVPAQADYGEQALMDVDMDHLWATMDWGWMPS